MLKIVFEFSEHQEKATYGLGYALTLTRNSDNSVLNKADVTNKVENRSNCIEWYVPRYTPCREQQKILSKQIVNRTPKMPLHTERSTFMKEVKTRKYGISS